MHPFKQVLVSLLCLSLAAAPFSYSQERDRSKIPDQYKWNLTDIYPTDDAWKKAKDQLIAEIPKIEQYQGTLGKSPQELLSCLDMLHGLSKEYLRLYSYASMSSDQDTRDSKHLAMQQEMSQIGSTFGAMSAFIEPEILKIDKATVDSFVKKEKKLEIYQHYLDDILRRRAHTGTEAEEKIIADASLMSDAPDNIYSIFSNADFPYPEVTLSDGKTVKLDKAAYTLNRAFPNREDRKKVFAAFFGKLNEYRRTFGAQLYAEVKKNLFYKKARKYDSCLQSALDASNIPLQVYHSLVENVNKNLGTFHRYLKLRKRILGLDELHYYDLYAPLLSNVDLKYSIEEAQKNIIASLAPLGDEYIAVTKKAFSERWIDVYPTEGKRPGAYMKGMAYDVHPYMLLNI